MSLKFHCSSNCVRPINIGLLICFALHKNESSIRYIYEWFGVLTKLCFDGVMILLSVLVNGVDFSPFLQSIYPWQTELLELFYLGLLRYDRLAKILWMLAN